MTADDTPKPAEPREWTLRLDTLIINNLTEGQQEALLEVARPVVHVVEVSALREAEAALYETKILLDQKEFTLQNTFNHWQSAMAERDSLRAAAQVMEEALEWVDKWAQEFVSARNVALLEVVQFSLKRVREMKGGGGGN